MLIVSHQVMRSRWVCTEEGLESVERLLPRRMSLPAVSCVGTAKAGVG